MEGGVHSVLPSRMWRKRRGPQESPFLCREMGDKRTWWEEGQRDLDPPSSSEYTAGKASAFRRLLVDLGKIRHGRYTSIARLKAKQGDEVAVHTKVLS